MFWILVSKLIGRYRSQREKSEFNLYVGKMFKYILWEDRFAEGYDICTRILFIGIHTTKIRWNLHQIRNFRFPYLHPYPLMHIGISSLILFCYTI